VEDWIGFLFSSSCIIGGIVATHAKAAAVYAAYLFVPKILYLMTPLQIHEH
jgi:hypothetical protein